MKQQFKEINLRPASLALIARCNAIIASYLKQRLRLTLRQLYYQLVVANVVTNTERSYQNLSTLVSNGRLAGLIDWDAIEDRVRQPRAASEFDDLKELTEAALASYRLPRWKDQDNYVELWVEKDALAGVLWPIARDYHVTMMVNRGYSSQSAMFESAERFAAQRDIVYEDDDANRPINGDRALHLLYLGDLDPSGEDMVRDVKERLLMFGVEVNVEKVALTIDQVKTYKPPPNPAKMTDVRAPAYVAKYGNSSWEVDALPPNVLNRIMRDALDQLVDVDRMDAVKEREEEDKKKLRKAVAAL